MTTHVRKAVGILLLFLVTSSLLFRLPSSALGEEPPAKNAKELLADVFAQLATMKDAEEMQIALSQVGLILELSEQTGDLHSQAMGLLLLAMSKSAGESFREAQALYDRSLGIMEELGDLFGVWMVLWARGKILHLRGELNDAAAILEQALAVLDRLESSGDTISPDLFDMYAAIFGLSSPTFGPMEIYIPVVQPLILRLAKSATLLDLAAVRRDREEYPEALAAAERALEISAPLGLLNGPILQEIEKIKEAMGEKADAVNEKAGDLPNGWLSLPDPTDPYFQKQLLHALIAENRVPNREEALLSALERLLGAAREGGHSRQEAVFLNNIGAQYSRLRRYDDALRHYEMASDLIRRIGDQAMESAVLNNIGKLRLELGRPKEALPPLQRSLKLARELEDREEEGAILMNLGAAHYVLARYDEALDNLMKSLAIAREIGDPEQEMAARNDLSLVLMGLNRFQESLKHQRESLDLARQWQDQRVEATILLNIAINYTALELLEAAAAVTQEARSIAEELADPALEIRAQLSLGLLRLHAGRPELAREPAAAALEAARRLGDRLRQFEALVLLGMLDLGPNPQTAVALLRQAAELAHETGFPEGNAAAHLYLATAYLQLRRYDEALAELEESLMICEDGGIKYHQALSRFALGLMASSRDAGPEAGDQLEQSADLLEAIREEGIGIGEMQAGFFTLYRDIYQSLVLLAARHDRVAAGFRYAEKARARAFLNRIGTPRSDLRDVASESLLACEQDLRHRMTRLKEELRAARIRESLAGPSPATDDLWRKLREAHRSYESLLLEIKERYPEYAALVSVDTLELAQVQAEVLPAKTSLVAYFEAGSKVLAWVVDRRDAHLVAIDLNGDELRRQVGYLNQMIQSRDPAFVATAAELYRKLIAPLVPYLRHRNLILVPHDVLHYLPFAALWDPDRQRFLVEDYALTHVPSASVLRFLAEKRTTNHGRLLVLANPDGSLSHAEAEAEAIARLYGARPFVRAEATESRIHARAGEIDVLHIAAHGAYDPRDPLFSRLELAAGDGHDGDLEVHEIFDLNLQGADLVVLSACETALGEQTRGDEIIGMARAFLYAGSPAVVTTLWPVDDAASAALMESFYRQLRQTSNLAEALRRAQLEVMANERWSSPYYWAAFALTGDSQWTTTEP